MSTSPNLQLARDLFAHFMEQRDWVLKPGNAEITPLLDGGDQYELDCLPGETIEAIAGNLRKALQLASEPAPLPTTGRNRQDKQMAADFERKDVVLFARVALALIEGERTTQGNPEAGAEEVLRRVQAMAAAYLSGAAHD